MIAEVQINEMNVDKIQEKNFYAFLICRLEECEFGFVVAECFACDTDKELKLLQLQLQNKPGIIEIAKNPRLLGKPN